MDKILADERKRKIFIWIAFAAIFIIALALRVKAIPKEGLWFDELYSVWVASGSFPNGILERLYNEDAHAPLYHFILHFYIKFFGNSFMGFHVFNLIISMFAFPVTYFLGCEVAGGKNNKNAYKFGLFATLLLAFNCFHTAFSQETRFYNLTGILLATSTLFLFKQINNGVKKSYLIGVLIPNVLMCYTITPGCIYVFLQALVFGVYFLFNKRELIKPLVATSFAAFLFYLPYIPFVYHQFWNSYNSFMGPYAHARIDTLYIMEIFYNWFAQTPMVYVQLKDCLDLSLDYNRARIALLVTQAALFTLFLVKSFTLQDKSKKLIFNLLLVFCSFHLIFLIFHISPFMPRYCLAFMPIFAICFAAALLSLKNNFIKTVIIAFLIVPTIGAYFFVPYKTCFMSAGRFGPGVKILQSWNLTSEDKVFKTHSAKLLPPIGIKATPIDVCLNATFLFYNPRRLEMIFGDDYLKYDTREQRDNYIDDYMFDDKINIHNKNYYDKQVKEMKKGARLVLWLPTLDSEYINFVKQYSSLKNISREDKRVLIADFTPKRDVYRYVYQKVEEDYRRLALNDKRLKIIEGAPLVTTSLLLFEKVKD